jgi:UV DNA damage endonuclease
LIARLGYACIALGSPATTNRSCRLANATPQRLRELTAANLAGLLALLRYNEDLGIRLFRISSALVPFASHPINALPWWDEFATLLAEAGAFAVSRGMRLSLHPGQFTVLSSPRPEVVSAAVADLVYHSRLLDAMRLGPEHKLIVHGGGTYGDKAGALARFHDNYLSLPEAIRSRLVVENDERHYSAQDVLGLSAATGLPVVFDALHDAFNPSPAFPSRARLLQACFATWRAHDGPPEVHFSSWEPSKKEGAHADWLDPDDFLAFARDTGETPVDCLLEAKQKELALLRLRADLAARGWRETA